MTWLDKIRLGNTMQGYNFLAAQLGPTGQGVARQRKTRYKFLMPERGMAWRLGAGLGAARQGKDQISKTQQRYKMKFQTKDTIHVDAAIILQRLKNSAPGQVIDYKELSSLIGRNVQAEARYIMETARRHAKKERIYFGVVTNVGLQRLDDSGKVKVGSGMLSKIRRTSRRAAQTLAAVENFNSLPNELKVAHNTALSVYGIITQATSRKLQERIAERVEGVEGGALAMKKSFELFA